MTAADQGSRPAVGPMSPAEVGRRVADDIERHGHDPLDNAGTGLWDPDGGPQHCTIVSNPTVWQLLHGGWGAYGDVDRYLTAVNEAVSHRCVPHVLPHSRVASYWWERSLRVSTADVLQLLRSLDDGML